MIENPYASPTAEAQVATREISAEELDWLESQQRYVNRLLNRGVIFSIIWVMGAGSFYSVYLAAKAHRLIRESNGEVRGMKRVWWCYAWGGLGIVLVSMILIMFLLNG
ncbi:hypothetical protein NA78x_005183 [Anatilimnocola sp. NA78]|uniref:hypothetical protein n=1 Tax=Anatilimnocola sp. NA78 TaxID=3415683 RepID=UPI003CE512CD